MLERGGNALGDFDRPGDVSRLDHEEERARIFV
jgi:hypothetical protein